MKRIAKSLDETQAIVLHSLVFVAYSVFDCLGNALARLTEGSTEHCRNTLESVGDCGHASASEVTAYPARAPSVPLHQVEQ